MASTAVEQSISIASVSADFEGSHYLAGSG